MKIEVITPLHGFLNLQPSIDDEEVLAIFAVVHNYQGIKFWNSLEWGQNIYLLSIKASAGLKMSAFYQLGKSLCLILLLT